ncbi:MAG: FeoB-associated Cys-rich membrane protein [Ruminococcaceae bacterium]|nr:FeoB-associated Cys-rich membrane protein [Oscillospiraceae bacterium]
MIENIIVIAILAAIVGGTVFYLIRAKKRGQKCIGCPYAKQCGGKCGENKK